MPETLANKIAAGEVVQRPASAEKELIENAIDAGADTISVVLQRAGSALIQVADNGCGMSAEDAVASFTRHATSKIASIEDLGRIRTLGFRGEALASIAAVAQVTLKTKRYGDEGGFLVSIRGGIIQTAEPCAAPSGTSIAVRNLFYNVPARRSFLKSPATEFRHLAEMFQRLAVANPMVAFSLRHDDTLVYQLPKPPTEDFYEALRQRICDLFGDEMADQIVPIRQTTSYLSASGFVGRAEFHRRRRGEQFLFVNGRYVRNRSLQHAVSSAYGNLLPSKGYPFYALFLELDPRHADVNVHPTKAEVKFDDERGVYGFTHAVVRKALGTADLVPEFDKQDTRPVTPTLAGSWEEGRAPLRGIPRDVASSGGHARGELSERAYAPPNTAPEKARPDGGPFLWQLHDRYILTQLRTGMMVMDQRAAHKRILYESALASMQSGMGVSQQLLFPHTVDLPPAEFELLGEIMPELTAIGFSIEVFSGRAVVVRGVPGDIRPGTEQNILEDMLATYQEDDKTLHSTERERVARSIARRGAIKAGESLTEKEMQSLIDRLFLCEMPYVSPDNRPTVIRISMEELGKRFAARK